MRNNEIIIWGEILFQIFLAKITRSPRPVTVNLQVTKHCNLRCPYCYADLDTLKGVKDPSTKETFETIDELYKYGCRHIILMGGEPLMRKDIGEVISYIKSKHMRCEIVTNGYFVERNIDNLKLCDSVCISLDGPKEENDKIRGEGCHKMVLKAMSILKENKIKTRIHAVLTRYTIENGPQYLASLAKKHGFPCNFSMITLRPELRREYIKFTEEEIVGFLKKYRRLRDEGFPIFTSDTCFDYMLNWPKKGEFTIYKTDDFTKDEMRWVVPCNYGQYNAIVDVDGSIYKCSVAWKDGLNWRKHGMKNCLEYIEKNLLNCVSCRSIGDIDRALALNFCSISNFKMIFKYIKLRIR